jgi:hypothetical protein
MRAPSDETEVVLPVSWADVIERPALWTQAVVPRLCARPGLWKCAPTCAERAHESVRFRSTESRAVARIEPSPRAFRAHFGPGPVACFDSLGRDARLIAPRPPGDFGHLWSFLESAPGAQIDALFDAVSAELSAWFEHTDRPVWLNTHGLGVPWLHVRLDSRPKYYGPGPYRSWPPG